MGGLCGQSYSFISVSIEMIPICFTTVGALCGCWAFSLLTWDESARKVVKVKVAMPRRVLMPSSECSKRPSGTEKRHLSTSHDLASNGKFRFGG